MSPVLIYNICGQWTIYAASVGKTVPGFRVGNECDMLRQWLEIMKAINS